MAARKRIDIIYNPVAGFKNRRRFEFLLNELEENGAEVRVHETRAASDASLLARQIMARRDTDIIVAAGGDGTINEVANGLADSAVPLAVLPLGTANVLAHEIELPRHPGRLARALMDGDAREIALGAANGRSFLLWVGAGLDAEITALVSSSQKRRWGKAAYVWAGVKFFLQKQAPLIDVRVGEEYFKAGWVIIANACCYAGRFRLTPNAHLCSRTLVVTICPSRRRVDVLRYLLALAAGRLHRQSDVHVREANEVELLGPVGAPIQIDGEGAGVLPQKVHLQDAHLRLVFPSSVLSSLSQI